MNADEYNQKQLDSGDLTAVEITHFVRAWQEAHLTLDVDGKAGPATIASIRSPNPWATFYGPEEKQPRNRSEVYDMFGDPGHEQANQVWKSANIVELHGSTELPGVPEGLYVHIHTRVEPYLREALRRVQAAGLDYSIKRLGGYVWRRIRHNPKKDLSLHSWGIAVDVDPPENAAHSFDPAGHIPEFMSKEWKVYWPSGIPREFVQAFASCGFAWGGDWDEDGSSQDQTYVDPMHFEWVARDGRNREV